MIRSSINGTSYFPSVLSTLGFFSTSIKKYLFMKSYKCVRPCTSLFTLSALAYKSCLHLLISLVCVKSYARARLACVCEMIDKQTTSYKCLGNGALAELPPFLLISIISHPHANR